LDIVAPYVGDGGMACWVALMASLRDIPRQNVVRKPAPLRAGLFLDEGQHQLRSALIG